MDELKMIISEMERRIVALLEKYDALVQENESLRNKILAMREQKKRYETLILEKSDELEALKVAQNIRGSNEKASDATRKINLLIKELDWCIARLSD